jgi:3',5'-nucleoside bisphosphate phosphatase
MRVHADLHVHTVLSPCGEVEMIPPLIVERALQAGLGLIAITDHNASANVGAVIEAACGTPLQVLPGMELQTGDQVHLLCLFDSLEQLDAWQCQVDRAMPCAANRSDSLGEQFVTNAAGEFVRRESRLLLVPVQIPLPAAVERVNALGGLVIPAHVDRAKNGLLALQRCALEQLKIAACEISPNISENAAREQFHLPVELALIRSSDAHWLDALGSAYVDLDLPGPCGLASLTRAFQDRTMENFLRPDR